VITLKNKGKSNREVARLTGINRKTVARYWDEYRRLQEDLAAGGDLREIQELIVKAPKYDSSSRKPAKYTDEIDAAIDEILVGEKQKLEDLGATHKQALTNVQIHELVVARGFDIGRTTVGMHVAEKRRRAREAFIRQRYDFGDRLEYDFGEVRLVIGGIAGTYYIAALASPAAEFRWGYLYDNQKKAVFLDSHVRFFATMGGVWREVVYDNMRNVVTRFIGRNEKELNADLVKMGTYYGFSINVTNCYAGNEKGYVESSVKWIRNKVFASRYAFDTLKDAQRYLQDRLTGLNAGSRIEDEKACLIPARPPLEIAQIAESSVDKYSFVRIDNSFYSVPDYLVGHTLTIKTYPEEVIVFSGMSEVCRHRRLAGNSRYSVDIFHYLDTLAKKPGAVKNSVALRSKARLKEAFDEHWANRPKEFIAELARLKGQPIDTIADVLCAGTTPCTRPACSMDPIAANVYNSTLTSLKVATAAFLAGGEKVAR
jgi:transposase